MVFAVVLSGHKQSQRFPSKAGPWPLQGIRASYKQNTLVPVCVRPYWPNTRPEWAVIGLKVPSLGLGGCIWDLRVCNRPEGLVSGLRD